MKTLTRRTLLRASGVAIALPMLRSVHGSHAAESEPHRMVAINTGLGFHLPNIVPENVGRDYKSTPYLKVLNEFRDQFTVISGTSHPGVGGGHQSGKSFLTAARHPNSAGFKNTISLDQLAAEQLGTATRFRSLSLSSSGPGLSWSRSGVEIPTQTRPSRVFEQLFLDGNPKEKAQQLNRLQEGRSVLDLVRQNAATMRRRLSGRDKGKIDQYFESVREAEVRLTKAQAWETRPKPVPNAPQPTDELDRQKMIERLDLMYDMMYLAIQSDSTRFITYYHTGMNAVPKIRGVNTDYHMLSHHGKDPQKLSQLTIVETEVMAAFGRFLAKLHGASENGSSLLDKTMVLFGSNLGNASSHDTRNLPIIFAGGGFRHGQHLAFDSQDNYALPKLYVSMLQRLGIEIDSFAGSTGTMNGIEV